MSIVITFGKTFPEGQYETATGGAIVRRGWSISWAKPVEPHILFALKFQIRVNDVEVEQSFMIRDLA